MVSDSNPERASLLLSPRTVLGILGIVALLLFSQKYDEKNPEVHDLKSEITSQSRRENSHNQSKVLSSSTTSDRFLEEIRENVFQSPAGLIYQTGSADGHRLQHVLQHARDDLDKPVHGVFTGSREEILALLDEVWTLSQERGPPFVEQTTQGRRLIVTANLEREIGYVGGQSGKRQGNPLCRKVRLVLEETRVITAYPMR